jgi:hypothetical protein
VTARWISQDPLGQAGGDVNLYRFVQNAYTVATDPSGLMRFDRDSDPSRYFKDLIQPKLLPSDGSGTPALVSW